MFKVIIFNLFFFAIFIPAQLFSNQIITVEATGISIINENASDSRENALNDAFKKAIRKALHKFLNISDNSSLNNIITSPKKLIDGYEIVEEKQIGNILNERIKVNINLTLLEKAVNSKVKSQLIYIDIFCSNDNSSIIDESCSDFIKETIIDIPDTIFIPYKNNFNENLSEVKDILVNVNYKLLQEKKIFSISRELDNLSINIEVLNGSNKKIFFRTYYSKILRKFNENIFNKIDTSLKESIKNDLQNIIEKVKQELLYNKKESKSSSFYLIIKYPKNYLDIKNVTELLEKFNVDFLPEEIENEKFFLKVTNKSINEVLKILRFANFKFKYIRAEKNIIIEF